MLQQTQAARVIPKYEAFIQKWGTAQALAKAQPREVLKLWSGLGYNRRAIQLKRAAEYITNDLHGMFPKTKTELEKLPGVGPYTAGAIMAFAYNKPEVLIETNIRSVYIHFFFKNTKSVADSDLLPFIEKTLDKKNPRNWYAALMDYGAMIKATKSNPSRKSKHHTKQTAFHGSVREVRGTILKTLLKEKKSTARSLRGDFEKERFQKALASLQKEGLVKKSGTTYTLL